MQKNKLRHGIVLYNTELAGIIEETEKGYRFTYDESFIKKNRVISSSLPVKNKTFESTELFSFFVGLLPEGWYLDIVSATLKIDKNDAFGLLLATCKDTIGAVSIKDPERND